MHSLAQLWKKKNLSVFKVFAELQSDKEISEIPSVKTFDERFLKLTLKTHTWGGLKWAFTVIKAMDVYQYVE